MKSRNPQSNRPYIPQGPQAQGGNGNGAYGRQAPATSQYSRTNPQYSHASAKRMGNGKKVLLGALATVLVLVLGGGAAFAMYMNDLNAKLAGDKTDEENMAIQDQLVPKTSYNEPFYMMLIGSDAREDDDSMGARSDTNIVVRVDPTECIVTMVSIPRDTMIEIDGYGTNKFNAAYNYGGAASTIREASQLTGVDISHFAEVNFEKLIQLVDAVGGVDVDVPELIDDPDAGNIVIQEGPQTLNGEAALVFARSRAYVDGDFTRTSNQRLLIEGLIKKVLSLPVTELPGVISKAAECVTTDMSVNDILSLATQFKDLGKLTVYSGMVPSTTGYIGEVSYVFTDEAKLKEMMTVVESGGDPAPIVATGDSGYPTTSNGSGNGGGNYYAPSSDYSEPDYSGGGTGGGSGYVDPGYTEPAPAPEPDPDYTDPGTGGGDVGGGGGGETGGTGEGTGYSANQLAA